MALWRSAGSVVILLAAAGTGAAQTYSLSEAPETGDCFRVQLQMKLSGEMRINRDGKTVPLKLAAAAAHEFRERILIVGKNGLPQKSARIYESAKAERWPEAKAILAEARSHLANADSDELGAQITRAEAEVSFAQGLERIRQTAVIVMPDDNLGSPRSVALVALTTEYRKAFAQAGLDLLDKQGDLFVLAGPGFARGQHGCQLRDGRRFEDGAHGKVDPEDAADSGDQRNRRE